MKPLSVTGFFFGGGALYRSMYVWVFVWLPFTGSLLFNQNWKSYFITKQPIEDGVSFLHKKLEEIQNSNLGIEGIQRVHWHEIISYWRHFGFNLERLLRASSIWLKAELLRVRLHKPPLFRAALSARKRQKAACLYHTQMMPQNFSSAVSCLRRPFVFLTEAISHSPFLLLSNYWTSKCFLYFYIHKNKLHLFSH